MGLVYLAEVPDGRLVAVKVIRPEYADDPVYRQRFAREARAAARVLDVAVARVLAFSPGGDGSPPYLVTEYVPGPSLRDRLAGGSRLPISELQAFAAGMARALAAVHAAGVVHRDVKPANVILSPTGPRLVDFGIARADDATTRYTTTGEIVGSVGWMAPEILRQEPVTAAADVFAWGAVVAFAGTGRRPFGEGPDVAVAHRILAGPPPDLAGIPPDLQALVGQALARDPRDRPPAAALASRLGAPGARGARPGRARRRVGAGRVVVVAAGGVLALAALLNPPGRSSGGSPSAIPSATPTPATTTGGRSASGHAGSTARPAPSSASARPPGFLVASVVPPVQDADVVFRVTNLRCGLRSVGTGERAQDEPAGVRACTAQVTVRNTGRTPHLLVPQTLHASDGRGYASNGFLTPRLGRRPLELHLLQPGQTLRSALVWELPAGVRPVDLEVHGDVVSLGTRRTLS